MSTEAPLTRLDLFQAELHERLTTGGWADVDLPVSADDGTHPVIAALGDESIGLLMKRIKAVGGYANVFVKMPSGVKSVSVLDVAGVFDAAQGEDFGVSDASDAPDADAPIAMFLDYLTTRPDGVRLPAELSSKHSAAVPAREFQVA